MKCSLYIGALFAMVLLVSADPIKKEDIDPDYERELREMERSGEKNDEKVWREHKDTDEAKYEKILRDLEEGEDQELKDIDEDKYEKLLRDLEEGDDQEEYDEDDDDEDSLEADEDEDDDDEDDLSDEEIEDLIKERIQEKRKTE